MSVFFTCFMLFNPNLGGIFNSSFWGGGGGGEGVEITPCLKLVRIMLEIWNLQRKTDIYVISKNTPFSYKALLILLMYFTQSNSVRGVLQI